MNLSTKQKALLALRVIEPASIKDVSCTSGIERQKVYQYIFHLRNDGHVVRFGKAKYETTRSGMVLCKELTQSLFSDGLEVGTL